METLSPISDNWHILNLIHYSVYHHCLSYFFSVPGFYSINISDWETRRLLFLCSRKLDLDLHKNATILVKYYKILHWTWNILEKRMWGANMILNEEEYQSVPDVIFISKHNHCPSIRLFLAGRLIIFSNSPGLGSRGIFCDWAMQTPPI